MNAWEANVRLMSACDKAIEHCAWCGNYGHIWSACQLYRMALERPAKLEVRYRAIMFVCGFVAGLALAGLLRGCA